INRRKSPHVEFVQNHLPERNSFPFTVGPVEGSLNHRRRAVHTLGLRPGSRIGKIFLTVETIVIQRSRVNRTHFCAPIPVVVTLQWGGDSINNNFNRRQGGSPDGKSTGRSRQTSANGWILHDQRYRPERIIFMPYR